MADAAVTQGLASAPGWSREGDSLVAAYKPGRDRVLAFYTALAALEDELNHHATVTILYGSVALRVNTHDAGDRITATDLRFAERVAALAKDLDVPNT
ncbi:4a-hydroxytetrahydrobiopterin dehydratase [Streptacidiphilus monticola]